MNTCTEKGIDVLATAFDGECFGLITEDEKANPLTLVQLQHKVFASSKTKEKRQLVKDIVNIAKHQLSSLDDAKCRSEYIKTGKVFFAGLAFPKSSGIEFQKAKGAALKAREKARIRKEKKSKNSSSSATDPTTQVPPTKQKKTEKTESSQARQKVSHQVFQPKKLLQMARMVVESPSYYKAALNVGYSEVVWPEKLEEWKSQSCVTRGMIGFPETWYSIPEFSERRKRIEHKVWDDTHIMTNMRRVVCSSGTKFLRKEAWLSASEDPKVKLQPVTVSDLPDKQDIGFALATFGEDVEKAMKRKNFHEEALFCKLIRNWWNAEDEPGMSALERMEHRMALRTYLLKDIDFGIFPPFTDYIKG